MRTLFYVRSGYQVAGHHQAHYEADAGLFNGFQVGMGHMVRCAILADAMGDATTLTHPDEPGHEYLKSIGVSPALAYDIEPEADIVGVVVRDRSIERLVIDHMETNNDLLAAVRGRVERLIVIVGVGWSITERTRQLADLIVFQGIGEPSRQVQEAPGGRIVRGLEYVIVGQPAPEAKRDGVLVFMGGSIPWSYSVETCKHLDGLGMHGTVVAGWHLEDTEDGLPDSFRKVSRLQNLAGLHASHELQVSSMGMSVFEAMAAGTPVVCVSREKDHWISAGELDDAGLLVDCGLVYQTSPKDIAGWAAHVYADKAQMAELGAAGRRAIDGRGVERVLEAMA